MKLWTSDVRDCRPSNGVDLRKEGTRYWQDLSDYYMTGMSTYPVDPGAGKVNMRIRAIPGQSRQRNLNTVIRHYRSVPQVIEISTFKEIGHRTSDIIDA